MKYIHSLINGELIKTNESVIRENPASLEKIYEVSMCSEKEVDLACNCAQDHLKPGLNCLAHKDPGNFI